MKSSSLLLFTFHFILFTLSGCGPTYPKERVDGCIIDICKREYGVDVEVKIVGKTIGVYIPIDELIDMNLKINPSAVGKVDDVIMSVSRVALSTDANFNFYVVVAQDPTIPELELVIIRYVEDLKRFLVTDISRSEYFDRMIMELKLTPQVQKEKLMRGLFGEIGLRIPDEVMEEYFESGYIDTISDIGYWNRKFFLKDLTKGEFLAKQVEERIRKDFSRVDSLKLLKLNFIEGNYKDSAFDFKIVVDLKTVPVEDISQTRTLILKQVHKILSKVFYGYKFEDYLYVALFYGEEKIVFTKENLDNLKSGKIRLDDII